MRRPAHQEKTLARLARWRETCPDLAVRSTFIVGFPGETEADFAFLLDWLKEARLARVGCFKYESVDGAAANAIEPAVPEDVKEERWHRFMRVQQEISAGIMTSRVGRTIDVIVDSVGKDGAVGRSMWDAPEIDGAVHLGKSPALKPGTILRAQVTRADAYDLWATPVA
jgi:ribosomal protein S12 methylthiotransferase